MAKKKKAGWKKQKGSKYFYEFSKKFSKEYLIKKIIFYGFKETPKGLNLLSSGGGFNPFQSRKVGGNQFLAYVKEKFKKPFHLTIYEEGFAKPVFRVNRKSLSVSVSFTNFKKLIQGLGDEIWETGKISIEHRLRNEFGKPFIQYCPNKESVKMAVNKIDLNALNLQDHQTLNKFIQEYFNFNQKNSLSQGLISDLVIQGNKKTLDEVIEKFEKYLPNKDFGEKDWQKFLHEEVFFFLTNYIESIRETDVNFGKPELGAKIPDFVLIDVYGYLDVFEIKTPSTEILGKRKDPHHKNFYFSSDASKAISQIEKYIYFLETNVDGYKKLLIRKTTNQFYVLKPKAFLIIGNSKEIERDPEKKADFRVLKRLFKNIEIITFDELLLNLKNLAKKFEKPKV